MRVLFAICLSLVLGLVPHRLTFAATAQDSCNCGCQCGMQPPPRPVAPIESASAVPTEARDEKRELRSSDPVIYLHCFSAERTATVPSAFILPPGVPIFQRHCALLI